MSAAHTRIAARNRLERESLTALALRLPPRQLATSDSLLAQMERATARWRWMQRKGNTP